MTEAVVTPDGRFFFNGEIHQAAIGAAGVRVHKHEGDHATPAGLLTLRRVLYRADRVKRPTAMVLREPISPDDGWCDDPRSPRYNTRVSLPIDERHEVLWSDSDPRVAITLLPLMQGRITASPFRPTRRANDPSRPTRPDRPPSVSRIRGQADAGKSR